MPQRELHPKGFFKAEILDHGFAKTDSGTNYFAVKFATLLEGEKVGEITGFFYLTDKAAEFTIQKIRAMGYEGDDLRDLAKVPPILQGRTVKISVEHHEYKGEMRDQVASVYPEDWEPGLKKDDEAAVNVARFNALLKKEKPAVSQKKAAGAENDDIPF
jgi:hypothetical protein